MTKKVTKSAKIIGMLRKCHTDTDRSIAQRVGCTPSLVAKVRKSGKHHVELPYVYTDAPVGVDVSDVTYNLTKGGKLKTDSNADLNPVNKAGVDPNAWTRTGILNQAEQYVSVDRAATHGDMEDNFRTIADLWTAYLGFGVAREDVAAMMALLKIARLKSNFTNADNWIDVCGYMACGGELATQKAHKK
jgi:hypothetical protein